MEGFWMALGDVRHYLSLDEKRGLLNRTIQCVSLVRDFSKMVPTQG
jgi:hypothetical protein